MARGRPRSATPARRAAGTSESTSTPAPDAKAKPTDTNGTAAAKSVRSAASPPKHWPVALFIPNLIGYIRVLTALAAFHYAFARPLLFFVFYSISYALDAVDGVTARRFHQTSSFGALLDMVTDRVATAGLLSILAALAHDNGDARFVTTLGFSCPYSTIYLFLMVLDVASHWVQMYRYVCIAGELLLDGVHTQRIQVNACHVCSRVLQWLEDGGSLSQRCQ